MSSDESRMESANIELDDAFVSFTRKKCPKALAKVNALTASWLVEVCECISWLFLPQATVEANCLLLEIELKEMEANTNQAQQEDAGARRDVAPQTDTSRPCHIEPSQSRHPPFGLGGCKYYRPKGFASAI